MKNAYAVKLQEQRKKRDFENTKEGFDFALNLCAVALNNIFGFGNERITRRENEVTRLRNDECGHDLEIASYGLARRIEQIRKGK